jgi:hypothetical protein
MMLDCGSPSSGPPGHLLPLGEGKNPLPPSLLPAGEGAERSEADEGEPRINPNITLETSSTPPESPRARPLSFASHLHSETATPETLAPRAKHCARDRILVHRRNHDSSRPIRSPNALHGSKNQRGNARSLFGAQISGGSSDGRVNKTTTLLRLASHFCDRLEPVASDNLAFSSLTHRGRYG